MLSKCLKNFRSLNLSKNNLSASRLNYSLNLNLNQKYFSSLFAPGSPFVREATDKIYPKVRIYKKEIKPEEIRKAYDETLKLFQKENYEQAFLNSNLLLNDSLVIKDLNLLHSVYSLIGDIQFKRGEFPSSAEKYESAYMMLILMKNNNISPDANVVKNLLINLSICYEMAEDYPKAIITIQRIIDNEYLKIRETDLPTLIHAYENYARIKTLEKDFKSAITYYEKCLAKLKMFDDNISMMIYRARVLTSMGNLIIQSDSTNLQKILKIYSNAYEILNKPEVVRDESSEIYLVDTLYYLAQIHRELANFKDSLKFALKLIDLDSHREKVNYPFLDFKMKIEILHLCHLNNLDLKDLNHSVKYLIREIDSYQKLNFNLEENQISKESLINVYSILFKTFIKYFDMLKNTITKEEIYKHLINYININMYPINSIEHFKKTYTEVLSTTQYISNKYTEVDEILLKLIEKMKYLANSYEIIDEKENLIKIFEDTISLINSKKNKK
jgi:hypothetical protein